MTRPPRILISAGEASGDRLGAGLARELLARRGDLELLGMGGEQMSAAGVRIVQDASEVAVMGLFEILSHLGTIRRAMRRLEHVLERERPDLVVPIDFPGFNLRLAERAQRAGVDVAYFVSPQIWAWHRSRVLNIRKTVREMLVLFPFEIDFYRGAGVPVTFVGHPVADRVPTARDPAILRREAGFDERSPIVALVPGSRRGEIRRLFPTMLRAARELQRRHEDLQFLVPIAPGVEEFRLTEHLGARTPRGLRLQRGGFPEILRICTAGVVTSGTASLEAAAMGMPMVVVYRVNPMTALLGRALMRVERIALPNLLAGREVVPELLQGACRPRRIADAVADYLEDPRRRTRVRNELEAVHRRLGGPGVFERAAERILALLDETGSGER